MIHYFLQTHHQKPWFIVLLIPYIINDSLFSPHKLINVVAKNSFSEISKTILDLLFEKVSFHVNRRAIEIIPPAQV